MSTWTFEDMHVYISNSFMHTHTHFTTCGINLGRTQAVELERTAEKATLDQFAVQIPSARQTEKPKFFWTENKPREM